jgi:hypothetical protein
MFLLSSLVRVLDDIGQYFFSHQPHVCCVLAREPVNATELLHGVEQSRHVARMIWDSEDLLQRPPQQETNVFERENDDPSRIETLTDRSRAPHSEYGDVIGLRCAGRVSPHGAEDATNGLGRGRAGLARELLDETRVPEQILRHVERFGDAV